MSAHITYEPYFRMTIRDAHGRYLQWVRDRDTGWTIDPTMALRFASSQAARSLVEVMGGSYMIEDTFR